MEASRPGSPLSRLLKQASIRRVELAARSGCSLQSVAIVCRCEASELGSVKLSTLAKLAAAMGVAPSELVPWLGQSPRSGLLWERGHRKRKRVEPPKG